MLKKIGIFGFLLLSLNACNRKESAQVKRTVSLGIWANYLASEMVTEFEKQTGIQVLISNYSSNEELLAKLQAGASGYDLVVPSDYMVTAMWRTGLLLPLNYAKIRNMGALDPRYMRRNYDPNNKYSVPYDWGTTGIAVNRSLYKGEIKGWKDLFTKTDLKGKFSILDDVREALGAALKSLGYSLNSKNPAELEKAKKVLLAAKARAKAFNSDTLATLRDGEVSVAHAYVSDSLQARKATEGKVDYLVPVEGGTIWVDNLVIPMTAKNVEEAYALLNFLLEAKTGAATVQAVFVAPASAGAIALLPPELKENQSLFPPAAVLEKCEMIEDLGEALPLWDRMWTEVKVGD